MDPRVLLPNSFNLARTRPVFAVLRDLFQPPSSGDTSYVSGSIITWNLPVGNHQWFDAKNSYIKCDVVINLTSLAVTTAAADVIIGFDKNTFALARKLRVFINGIMCEDLDKYNVLHPTIESFSALRFGNSSLYSTGEYLKQFAVDYKYEAVGGLNTLTAVANARTVNFSTDEVCGGEIVAVATAAADAVMNFKELSIFLPSPLVGIYANKCLPAAFFNSVMIEYHLEYAHVAVKTILSTFSTNHAVASAGVVTCTNVEYTLSNIKWMQRFIELDGDLLATISEAYVADGIPRFVIPCRMWRWRFNTFSDGSTSINLPFTFNISSAVCFVGVMRPSNLEDRLAANIPKHSLSARYCNIKSYTYYINGNPHPAHGLGVIVNADTQTANTSAVLSTYSYHSDAINKCIGTLKKSLNTSTTYNEFLFSPVGVDVDFSQFAKGAVITGLSNADTFVLGYPLEPGSAVDSSTRAGPKLTAANDVNLYLSLAAAGAGTTIRLDLFILMDAEIIYEGGAVQFSGGT